LERALYSEKINRFK